MQNGTYKFYGKSIIEAVDNYCKMPSKQNEKQMFKSISGLKTKKKDELELPERTVYNTIHKMLRKLDEEITTKNKKKSWLKDKIGGYGLADESYNDEQLGRFLENTKKKIPLLSRWKKKYSENLNKWTDETYNPSIITKNILNLAFVQCLNYIKKCSTKKELEKSKSAMDFEKTWEKTIEKLGPPSLITQLKNEKKEETDFVINLVTTMERMIKILRANYAITNEEIMETTAKNLESTIKKVSSLEPR